MNDPIFEKIQSALEEMFPGKQILITMHYELVVDNVCIPSTGSLMMDLYKVHGAGTIADLVRLYAESITKYLAKHTPQFEIASCPTVNLKKFDGVHDIVTGHKMSKEKFVKCSEILKKHLKGD